MCIQSIELEGYEWDVDPHTGFIQPTGHRRSRGPRPYHLDEIWTAYVDSLRPDESPTTTLHPDTNKERVFMTKVGGMFQNIAIRVDCLAGNQYQ